MELEALDDVPFSAIERWPEATLVDDNPREPVARSQGHVDCGSDSGAGFLDSEGGL